MGFDKLKMAGISLAVLVGGFAVGDKISSLAAPAALQTSSEQVTFHYPRRLPVFDDVTHIPEAYDPDTMFTSYSTQSKGRLMWSESTNAADAKVNYDAVDVHVLGDGIDESTTELYKALYEACNKAALAVQ